MELGAGTAGTRCHHLTVLHGIQTPAGSFSAPIADILTVEVVGIIVFHAVFDHGIAQFCRFCGRKVCKSLLLDRQQAFAQQFSLLVFITLTGFQQIAHNVIQQHRAVGQAFPAAVTQSCDKVVILEQQYIVRIGKDPHAADLAVRIVTDVHGGSNFQHGFGIRLACVGIGRQLGIPEGIHNTVVADPVAGAEVLVGGIVEHTPAEAARMLTVCRRIILDTGMAQGVFLPSFPGIEGLGGEHMAVVFGDQQSLVHVGGNCLLGLAAGILAGVGEIVVGIHILQQVALFYIAHAAGGAAGIQFPGNGICALVQFVIVLALVDANAPHHDTGMVTVLQHHLPGVDHCLILPFLTADVLPAGDFREYKQAEAITFVDKVVALGIVGSADRHAAQFFLQNTGILPLEAFRGRIAHIRPALMPV